MSCLVYGCRCPADSTGLCRECYTYLKNGVGSHETLMRPKWELTPTLKALHRCLTAKDATMRDSALTSLAALIERLDK